MSRIRLLILKGVSFIELPADLIRSLGGSGPAIVAAHTFVLRTSDDSNIGLFVTAFFGFDVFAQARIVLVIPAIEQLRVGPCCPVENIAQYVCFVTFRRSRTYTIILAERR